MENLSFKVVDNTIVSYINCAIDETIIQQLVEGITELVPNFNGGYWGYVCVSAHQNEVSEQVEQTLVAFLDNSWESGCIAGAYVLATDLAVEQMNKIAKAAGSLNGIENRVFKTDDEAIAYTEELLKGMEKNNI